MSFTSLRRRHFKPVFPTIRRFGTSFLLREFSAREQSVAELARALGMPTDDRMALLSLNKEENVSSLPSIIQFACADGPPRTDGVQLQHYMHLLAVKRERIEKLSLPDTAAQPTAETSTAAT